MSAITTTYEFTLPRGYVDGQGRMHRTGVMRLATARDELEPLRDPTVSGPDDPRLTILVLARVVERLGEITYVTTHEIENLFAADLAFLQDFYGVINFGNREEYDELVRSQKETPLRGTEDSAPDTRAGDGNRAAAAGSDMPSGSHSGEPEGFAAPPRSPNLRAAVEELPRRAQ